MRGRLLYLVLAYVALPWLIGSVPAQDVEKPVATVLRMSGNWYLVGNPRREIHVGQELPEGGALQLAAQEGEARTSFIDIALRSGSRMYISCERSSCNQPLPLPGKIKPEPSLIERFWRLLGVRAQDEDVAALARGGGLQDQVLSMKETRVDLSAVFQRMPKDSYLLRLQLLDNEGRPRDFESSQAFLYDWTPGRVPSLSAVEIKPGLYRLEILEKDSGGHPPSGQFAWVLITSAKEFQELKQTFNYALMQTHTWEGGSASPAARIFLRAYMNFLASEKLK